jgi:hypothetical protein
MENSLIRTVRHKIETCVWCILTAELFGDMKLEVYCNMNSIAYLCQSTHLGGQML